MKLSKIANISSTQNLASWKNRKINKNWFGGQSLYSAKKRKKSIKIGDFITHNSKCIRFMFVS